MVCTYCGSATDVSNSRPLKRINGVWRRRSCKRCGSIVTTIEQIDLGTAIRVERLSGSLEPFSRDKLYISIYESLGHRKTAQEDATKLSDTIIGGIVGSLQGAVCSRQYIVEQTISVLDHFDKAAATHYRAYHPLNG